VVEELVFEAGELIRRALGFDGGALGRVTDESGEMELVGQAKDKWPEAYPLDLAADCPAETFDGRSCSDSLGDHRNARNRIRVSDLWMQDGSWKGNGGDAVIGKGGVG
jgi:hypothetical protein